MKALVLTDKKTPLVLKEVSDPTAGPGEAIVRMHAAALNHRDVWIQLGQYAGLRFPIIPGSDGAGVVETLGPVLGGSGAGGGAGGASENWKGKEVIIDPAINWGTQPGYQDPKDFRILGLPDDGTLATFVRVPVVNLVEKPAHLSWEEAAALPLAGVTAFRATMVRGQVRAGEKVLITGIGGGVALFALQYALAAGAQVWVTSGSNDKLNRALALGAVGGANYKASSWAESLRSQAGAFDVTIDGAAGDGVNDLLDLAAPGGRVVFYGATRGNPSSVVARRIFWKQLNVLGSTMGSPEDFQSMVAWVNRHKIRPVVDKVFPFSEGEAAFRHMENGQQFGKIIVRID